MRRKNFYLVEVDVYNVGIGLSKNAVSRAKDWLIQNNSPALSELVLSQNDAKNDDAKAAAVLKFVRNVTKQQFVDAFDDVFKDCNREGYLNLKNAIGSSIGDNIKTGDEITFYWVGTDKIIVYMNGVKGGSVSDASVARRLLDIYVDPSMTVSKELVHSLDQNTAKLAISDLLM